MAFSKPKATLLARLLCSAGPRLAPARHFRATAAAASAPKDPADAGDATESTAQSADEREDLDSLVSSTYQKFVEMTKKLQAVYPEAKILDFSWPLPGEDYDKMVNNTCEMLGQMKQKLKAEKPELSAKWSEVLYWHPFQVKGQERAYDVRVDEDNWCARIDIPGIGSKDVKVQFKDNSLFFSAEEKDRGNDARAYSSKFDIPPGEFQTDKISATVKNGVLEILIPKINS